MKEFFGLVKANMGAIVSVFITGVMPAALADISGGFNIIRDISRNQKYLESSISITITEWVVPWV